MNLVIMSPEIDEQGSGQPENPVIMPPERDEQGTGKPENPEEKKSKFMLNKWWILNNIIVTACIWRSYAVMEAVVIIKLYGYMYTNTINKGKKRDEIIKTFDWK